MENVVINSDASCLSCTKCIRQCVVKSIHHDGSKATIDSSKCISCGACVDVCPSDYIHVQNRLSQVKELVSRSSNAVASISPQWMAEFPNIDPSRMIEALSLLGFKAVSQTSAAVPYMSSKVVELYNQNSNGVYLSSICPVVTSLVEKYHHNSVERIVPVPSLTVLHSRMLKSYYGADVDVVVISGCIADKREAGCDDIAAVINFDDLVEWFSLEKIDFDMIPGNDSYQYEPKACSMDHHHCVVSGGIFNTRFSIKESIDRVEFLTVTGVERISKLLSDINYDHIVNPLFLDLYACEGGCLSSSASLVRREITAKNMNYKNRIAGLDQLDTSGKVFYNDVIVNSAKDYYPRVVMPHVSDDALVDVFHNLGIDGSSRISDCGACGYSSCHDFAEAIGRGSAVSEMCLWNQYTNVTESFDAYIRTSRSGIFIVDEQLRIVQSNQIFASLFGVDTLMYENNPGLKGADISTIVPFSKSISTLLRTSDSDIIEKDIEISGLMVKVTLIALRGQRKVCGIVRNLFMNDVAREEIISRTRQVIDDNLATIQQIAYLLGDTASKTEVVLNSIIESQNENYE